jgi:CheY-like chemotaxis protein
MENRATILVVDDDPDIRSLFTEILEEEGFSVVSAANGQEALEFLHSAKPLPTLILLDLMMPRGDGFDFVAQQRRVPEWSVIPIIITSATNDVQRKADTLDAAGYLIKPIQLEDLITTVNRFCGRETDEVASVP